ncbi:hypothetical protein ERO13_D04G087850v2 [Gossypium hirsutum]|uniref:Uncharacterized protein n=6 Tax=Gossypium TaxID=3633 RepID=A0A0D2V4F6_GOSRA|nr:hypothetical protein ES319_D04G098300v1 [Gossypium barbadense]KAG4151778.1 hypothetical protein ERO13_D04G087850v2 [Gossypium hirsutum]KJB76639.1 hypothetical protein B456_012G098000 [Gossypium raimondii]MBA0572183.1 hypothetical protein [Gossypium lobatum]MBA0630617.1 hypothetical protein [Gossypium davidsonii]MBA0697811.1 hypothetical protein [Gossypium aridum]TYI86892.1 hypothetical protein E1A91_D04G098300v1 [Gossypium mustelinum]
MAADYAKDLEARRIAAIGTQRFLGFELRGIERGEEEETSGGAIHRRRRRNPTEMVKPAAATIGGLAPGTVKAYPS